MTTVSIPHIAQTMQTVVNEDANELGRTSGFVQRQVKVTGANFAQTLVFGWLQKPTATLENLCQTAAALDLVISPQGLAQRFTPVAATFLQSLFETTMQQTMCAEPVALEVLNRFPQVVIEDSSTVTLPTALAARWPGCGGSGTVSQAAVKMQVRWDMCRGGLDGPHLVAGKVADKVASQAHDPLPVGALRITDLGYWKLDTLKQQDHAGIYFLTRLQSQTFVFSDHGWVPITTFLQTQTADRLDVPVQIGKQTALKTRLLAVRVPADVARQRKRKLRQDAKRKGKTVSDARLALAHWTVLVTNVPQTQLTLDEALVFMQMRWQIELLFKLWKEHGLLDESRSDQPYRILCEFFAKLIAMIIQHWTLLCGTWAFPNRSLVKAAAVVRQHALAIATALTDDEFLVKALTACVRAMAVGSRINKSRKTPRLFQLLLAFEAMQP